MAGKKWFYNFMRTHSRLSLRQPEATSLARMRGLSKDTVLKFLDILEELVNKHKLDGTRIYNVNESGFTTVKNNSSIKWEQQVVVRGVLTPLWSAV